MQVPLSMHKVGPDFQCRMKEKELDAQAQATTRVTIKRRERDGTNMKHQIVIHDQNKET